MRKHSTDSVLFNTFSYIFIIFESLICLIPFIMLIAASFSDETALLIRGYGLLPRKVSTAAYALIFQNPATMIRAYGVTVFVTAVGSVLSLFFMSMAAYVISNRQFKWRNQFSFYFFFTTLFSGGIVPWYILMIRYLHMKNNLAALIIPYLFNVFYIIILRTFMSSIPDAVSESAKIDGAGDFRIFMQLILPLSKPALATIGLFVALNYWNDWYLSMMFINKNNLFSLQYYLYNILNSIEGLKMAVNNGASLGSGILPTETLKNALAVVVTGPILILYPFVQKYFVKGLTIGAVKG